MISISRLYPSISRLYPSISRLYLSLASLFLLFACTSSMHAQFVDPTPAELAMTSVPEVPGAAAVYLYREETTEDERGMFSFYTRIKVLTEKGKDFANVDVPYVSGESGFTTDSVSGRTIHADGKIFPMTEKPYKKMLQKGTDYKYMASVFTLPSVEVGSIIEYRYKQHLDDHYYRTPRWFIQSELFTLKAHYMWKPTNKELIMGGSGGREQISTGLAWMPILPKGAELKKVTLPGSSMEGGENIMFTLDVKDIPPAPEEEFMPPIESLNYRVIFYHSAASSGADFWKTEGKYWAKTENNFIGPGPGVKGAVQQLVLPADTQDQKLRKLYAAVMALENTSFTRQHSTSEERASGLGVVKSADDVLARKRGNDDQLTDLFIAMARAAGFKAYSMRIVSRDRSLFIPGFMDMSQLDDNVAIVEVDGKEMYFDPGQRFCDYGHLAWKHTLASGLRQTATDPVLASTPGESYKTARVDRVANLVMDASGGIVGTVDMTFNGDSALSWRQQALRGDDTNLNHDLRETVEEILPHGLEVRVTSVDNMADYTKALAVHYKVSGTAGTSTGKRLLIPADLFCANFRPTFAEETRKTAVYFHYTYMTRDAVRIHFPDTIAIESLPTKELYQYKNIAAYAMAAEQTANTFTVRRDFTLGAVVFPPADFPELKTFYKKFETKDQEPVVLTHKDAVSASAGAGANAQF